MTKRILFVSIAFPPKGDPECIQTGRYFYYLSTDKEFIIDVVTSRSPTLFMPIDLTLSRYAKVNGQLIEIPIYESKYVNYLMRKFFPAVMSKPDSKMTFHWQWRNVVRNLKVVPDIIYSRSFPLSSAVMALKLSENFNVPWVMHLSDPWTENALHSYSQKELSYHSKMEMKCFGQASIISFTSEGALALYQRKYSMWASKMRMFPNVYDPEGPVIAKGEPKVPSGITRIVYTGGLANTRSALSLLSAINLMIKKDSSLSNRIEVLFAGDMDRRNKELFKKYQFSFLKHLGLISADKAKELQNSADLLVVIDSDIDDSSKEVFFPSKLLDYAILGKPILAITGKGSVTDNFVTNHGGASFSHTAVKELSLWLQSYIEGNVKIKMKQIVTSFAADNQASKLIRIFKNLIE